MEYEFVKVEKRDHISIVTINRPEVYNAVHPPLSLELDQVWNKFIDCLLYTSPSPRDKRQSRMPSSA